LPARSTGNVEPAPAQRRAARCGLVDELPVFSPCLVFDPALGMAQLPAGLARLADRVPLAFEEVTRIGADLRLRLRVIAREV
jgi:hypothetical protein